MRRIRQYLLDEESVLIAGRMILLGICLILQAGCLSPIALHRAMIEYDRSVFQAEKELLLLNIARLEDKQAPHFTVTTNIAATFDFRTNAGMTARLLEGGSSAFNPNAYTLEVGTSVAENPTVSIIPIKGEEFTRRVLLPLDSQKFQFLLFQGQDLQQLLRLTARGIEIHEAGQSRILINSPRYREEYEAFRRIVLHIDSLEQSRQLYVVPLDYTEETAFALERAPGSGEIIQALKEGFSWKRDEQQGGYVLTRSHSGRLALTNYPGTELSNDERREWNQALSSLPPNIIAVDIRPQGPGGTFPIQGHIRLRSFNEMLGFLGDGIRRFPEYPVSPDSRTGPFPMNPDRLLTVEAGSMAPDQVMLKIAYDGEMYWIPDQSQDAALQDWNQQLFALLYQIFQMTVTDVSKVLTPGITIAK